MLSCLLYIFTNHRIEQSCFACNDIDIFATLTPKVEDQVSIKCYIFCLHKMCVKLSVEILNVVFGLFLFKKYKLTTN